MRLQLSGPESGLIGPDLYNQLFTMHGTTMMFLFAVPVMEAIGIYLVPLMVGTRNIAFPAPQRLQLLDLSVRRHLRLGRLHAQHRAGRRLVRLRAAVRARSSARQAGRRLGADDHLHRGLGARGRGRDHRHRLQAARARHDARPHPALRLGDAGDLVRDHLRHAGGDDRLDLPDPRPAGRHPLLQSGRGRRRAAVAAPVLVLRPPGGLHHLPAGDRHGLVDHRRRSRAGRCSAIWRWCCR